jgi:HK97 family phage prohead protease
MHLKTKFLPLDLKAADDATGVFSGYGSVFGNQDSYGDVVERGAFERSLKEHRAKGTFPRLYLHHDPAREAGEWLDLREDDRGLWGEGRLWIDGDHPDPDALKAYRGVKAKNNRMGLSIGYVPKVWERDEESQVVTLKEIDLWEVSVTPHPANDLARVEAAKQALVLGSARDLEDLLRQAGLSRDGAKKAAAGGWPALSNRKGRDGPAGGCANANRDPRDAGEDGDAPDGLDALLGSLSTFRIHGNPHA